jgi:hypothetical protein
MRKGAGFHGSLYNMDVSSDQSIGHISIDKSPRLHAQVLGYVTAAVGGGGRRLAAPPKATAVSHHAPDKPEPPTGSVPAKPAAPANGASNEDGSLGSLAATGTPIIAQPERPAGKAAATPATKVTLQPAASNEVPHPVPTSTTSHPAPPVHHSAGSDKPKHPAHSMPD